MGVVKCCTSELPTSLSGLFLCKLSASRGLCVRDFTLNAISSGQCHKDSRINCACSYGIAMQINRQQLATRLGRPTRRVGERGEPTLGRAPRWAHCSAVALALVENEVRMAEQLLGLDGVGGLGRQLIELVSACIKGKDDRPAGGEHGVDARERAESLSRDSNAVDSG